MQSQRIVTNRESHWSESAVNPRCMDYYQQEVVPTRNRSGIHLTKSARNQVPFSFTCEHFYSKVCMCVCVCFEHHLVITRRVVLSRNVTPNTRTFPHRGGGVEPPPNCHKRCSYLHRAKFADISTPRWRFRTVSSDYKTGSTTLNKSYKTQP